MSKRYWFVILTLLLARVWLHAQNGGPTWFVQAAAVQTVAEAEQLEAALKQHGFAPQRYTRASEKIVHLRVGPFSAQQAATVRDQLTELGYNAVLQPDTESSGSGSKDASPQANGLSTRQAELEAQALAKLDASSSTPSPANNKNNNDLEARALAKLEGSSPAPATASGTDLETQALEAMKRNTEKNKEEAEKQRREQEQLEAELAAQRAATQQPANEPRAASVFNTISGMLSAATSAMQNQAASQQTLNQGLANINTTWQRDQALKAQQQALAAQRAQQEAAQRTVQQAQQALQQAQQREMQQPLGQPSGQTGLCPNGKYVDEEAHCDCRKNSASIYGCFSGSGSTSGPGTGGAPARPTTAQQGSGAGGSPAQPNREISTSALPSNASAQENISSPDLTVLQQQQNQLLEQLHAQSATVQDSALRQQLQTIENSIASLMREGQNEETHNGTTAPSPIVTAPSAIPVQASQKSTFSYAPPPSGASSGTQQPPPCADIGTACIPLDQWKQMQAAIDAAPTFVRPPTHTPTGPPSIITLANFTASGPDIYLCPRAGHIATGYYAANDVWIGNDTHCTPGHQLRITWPTTPANGPSTTSNTSSSSGNSSASGSSPENGSGKGNESVSDVVSSPCSGVVGRWVQDKIFPTKQDLVIDNLCAQEISVKWFLGQSGGSLKTIAAFAHFETGQGIYPGMDSTLSIYACPMDHPVAIQLNGSLIDGHHERYHCAKGTAPQ